MAMLHCVTPSGSIFTINLETMNIVGDWDPELQGRWWCTPNGLIIQKGITQGSQKIADGVYRVTFPIAYGGSAYYSLTLFARPTSRLSPRFVNVSIASNDTTGSYATLCVENASFSPQLTQMHWIAIGE